MCYFAARFLEIYLNKENHQLPSKRNMAETNFSRRNFIGMTGIAGAGLALSGSPLMATQTLQSQVQMQTSRKFKMGLIGCGNRCRQIVDALNNVQEIEMTAFCDVMPHKMQLRAEQVNSSVKPQLVPKVDDLLKMQELDCIAIFTENDSHRDITIAGLQAGKHVWCEKPMGLTVAECNDIIGEVGRTGKLLQIGHQRRHSPEYIALIEAVRSRPLGTVLQSSLFDYRGDWRVPEAHEAPEGTTYWRLIQKLSGGVVYEMGAHIIDINNWIFDSEPVAITSLQGVNNFTLRKRDSSDHAGVLVEYANGSLMNYGGNVYNYGSTALDTWFCVHGTVQHGGGNLTIRYGSPPGFPRPQNMPQNEQISLRTDNREGDGAAEQFRHFAKAMDGKAKPFPDMYDGRRCVQILEGSVRAANERRVINVRELG